MPRGSILLVDDEESVRVTMQAVLEMDGYEVTPAEGGTTAVAHLRQRQFDLVLTDLRLDDLDGLTVLAEARKTSPDTVTIMLTGYASLESAVQALRQGAYDYLFKPSDVEELRATVARAMERRELTLALHARMGELQEANETIRTMNSQLQVRVDEATAELRQRVEDLARARDEIAALHRAAQEHVKQLEELDRVRSQFLSMASHELKTPLTSISGFLQLALRRARRRITTGYPAEEDWRQEQQGHLDHLEMINTQVFRLARLVDELLDVSRIESGKLELRLGEVDVRKVASEAVARMQHTTTKHHIRLDAPPAEESVVRADRDYLEQVFTNLVGNAIKYSPDGGRVDVGVHRFGEEVQITVRDQGVGIPQDELDTIFSLFYRSRDATARQAGGMGLGLYISKEIVARHSGRIWAESTPGRGSTFYVALPANSEAQSLPVSTQTVAASR